MKICFTLLLSVFITLTTYSQEIKMCGYQGYQTVEEVTTACDLQDATKTNNNTEDAEEVVDAILDKVGLFRNFLIEECDNINNALAVTMPLDGGNIDRYILYDIEFFKKVTSSTGTDWGLTSILAHEVGHHLNGHTLKTGGSNHRVELQADEFSGFVLARMNCSLEDAQSAVSKLLPDKASSTHPAKQDRLDAIAKGWSRGSGKTIPIKKITVEEKKEIIEDNPKNEDESKKRALQIIGNYLDAIGGQEKISSLKTMTQKMKMISNGKSNVVGNIEYISVMEYKRLSPNKVINKTTRGNEISYALNKDGKFYTKDDENDEWKFSFYTDAFVNTTSYILEYSWLVNNVDLKYKGIKTINGIKCYEIEVPSEKSIRESKENFVTTTNSQLYYYDVSSGLLKFVKMINHSYTDYIGDKEHIKDTETTTETTALYKDYQPVGGILFPFKMDTKYKSTSTNETFNIEGEGVLEYLEMEANPIINKNEFIVNE